MKYLRAAMVTAGVLVCGAVAAQTQGKGDPAKAQQIVTQVCSACHGADGNSPLPVNPSLAGQHPEYTLRQLMGFRSQGGKPAERPNPVMSPMVASLSPEDMDNLAAYFAVQKPKPAVAGNAELVALGRSIYRGGLAAKGVAACASCHSPNGAGIPAMFPRLSGQHAQYTTETLKAYRAGTRANDPNGMMRATAQKLSDREIAALAEYIAGLR